MSRQHNMCYHEKDPDGYCYPDFEDSDDSEDEDVEDCKDIWVTKSYPLFGVPKRPKFTIVEEHSGFVYDLKERIANLRACEKGIRVRRDLREGCRPPLTLLLAVEIVLSSFAYNQTFVEQSKVLLFHPREGKGEPSVSSSSYLINKFI
jgi:hypothetical protein